MSASVGGLVRSLTGRPEPRAARRPVRRSRVALNLGLGTVALLWLFPFLWAVYASLRSYDETARRGYVSLPEALTLDNYAAAWLLADLPRYFLNSALVVVPSVVIVLVLSSVVAFSLSRVPARLGLGLLMLFAAGNLLPPQAIAVPLHRLFLALPVPAPLSDNGVLYDQHVGLVLIHVAFQLGFCTLVLGAWMRTLPRELVEAAVIDGASHLRALWHVVLPLCRPALAALAVLQVTWIYNDFFWGLVLMRTGDKRPMTSALNSLKGEYFTDTNLLAAGAVMAALPTLVVFLVLRRHFARGLTLGSVRG